MNEPNEQAEAVTRGQLSAALGGLGKISDALKEASSALLAAERAVALLRSQVKEMLQRQRQAAAAAAAGAGGAEEAEKAEREMLGPAQAANSKLLMLKARLLRRTFLRKSWMAHFGVPCHALLSFWMNSAMD